jgi:hypothetical protein
MQELSLIMDIEAKPEWTVVMYKHLANSFDDEEFEYAIHKMLQSETFYGKLPTVAQFMKYRPNRSNIKKMEFLERVSNYLQLDYVCSYDREKFAKETSEFEGRVLRYGGGISEMYSRVHNLDYPASISKIIADLSDFYDDNYSVEADKTYLISDETKKLLSGMIKKIED